VICIPVDYWFVEVCIWTVSEVITSWKVKVYTDIVISVLKNAIWLSFHLPDSAQRRRVARMTL
jgi:hypothetical protein